MNVELTEILMRTYTVVLPMILGWIGVLLSKQKKDRKANCRGTMLLLRKELMRDHDKYVQLGEIPNGEYENWLEMYEAYKALGGNGMVTKMYDEIHDLHLKIKER